MSKTEDLTTRSNAWFIILNKPSSKTDDGFNVKDIYKKLMSAYSNYFIAMIKHYADTNDDGTLKTTHIHIVMTSARQRKGTLINNLAELLEYPQDCITISKCKSLRSACRYLLHLDDDDKTKYAPFEITSNDYKYFESFLIDRIEHISEEELVEIVKELRFTSKILIKIGLENYKRYATAIRDLQKELA